MVKKHAWLTAKWVAQTPCVVRGAFHVEHFAFASGIRADR
jgi:hypothetical protein